ncbi:MAG: hypothetical protein J6K81_02440 [Rikenellaceae bacterium]|nr:hypothetical protein [Rikenellaceae bacterium]
MKRFILFCAMACATLMATAQTSTEILRRVSSAVESLGNYTADFVMTSAEGNANGSYSVEGARFRINGGGVDMVCDGTTMWAVDHAAREVVVETVDNSPEASVWTNPAKAFSMLDSRFEHKLLGRENESGKTLYRINLNSRQQNVDGFTLLVDAATSLPWKAIYGVGELRVTLHFVRIVGGQPSEPSRFEYSSEEYSDYEVIDFR